MSVHFNHTKSDATLRVLKTYEKHGPTLQLFYAFPLILIHKQKFQLQFPAKFVEKRIAQVASLVRWHLTRAFERGAIRAHWATDGLNQSKLTLVLQGG